MTRLELQRRYILLYNAADFGLFEGQHPWSYQLGRDCWAYPPPDAVLESENWLVQDPFDQHPNMGDGEIAVYASLHRLLEFGAITEGGWYRSQAARMAKHRAADAQQH